MKESVCNCGVPFNLHNNGCGWGNAKIILAENEAYILAPIPEEDKEIRWLISQSPNAHKLLRYYANNKSGIFSTTTTVPDGSALMTIFK